METGTVHWFDSDKGYGFITRDNGQGIFVHWTAVKCHQHGTLTQGQRVQFDVVHGHRGPKAANVRLAE